MAAEPALAFGGLTYRYAGGHEPSLSEVTLEVEPGEFVLLAGRSGSGKTSLLRAGCGLIPHFHGGDLGGSVRVAGRDTRTSGPGELADVAGYVAQDPETQIVSTTVGAELELPLRLRGDHPAGRARAVEEVALALNIPHLLDRPVETLSGGESQRVALAVALVTRPPLVLLDEPTSQLDPVAGDELIWLLRRLNEEWGVAVLLAEHRLERCLAACDRVIVMESGWKAFDGSPRAFLEHSVEQAPALATPAARMFSLAGIDPLPVGVRDARATLRVRGLDPPPQRDAPDDASGGQPPAAGARDGALNCRGLWVELDQGQTRVDVLRGIDLTVGPGEKVALMGRNGAGKSTLLRAAAGLVDVAAGKVETPGGMALLTQNPGDYIVRDRVGDELPGPDGAAALRAVGLEVSPDADPRELSGGERQRLALAITLAGRTDGRELPGLVALDEPTRGMDRDLKDRLTGLGTSLAGRGAALVIATHDVEFAVGFADRVVLLGDGEVIADADAGIVLSGGWYFASEVARVLGRPGVTSVENGAELLLGHGLGTEGEPDPGVAP